MKSQLIPFFRLLVVGCWFLVLGSWLSVPGFWLSVVGKPFNPSTFQPFNSSTLQLFNLSTLQPFNPSTFQPFNSSTLQLFNLSTLQPFNPSTFQPFNSSTLQLFNPSTLQPFNPSTLQLFNPSTLQLFNPSTLQPFNLSTLQPFNPSTLQPSLTAKYFDFSRAAKDTYHKITGLRFVEAHAALDALQRSEPDNLMAIYLENYLDFFTVFVNDKKDEYQRLARNMEPRLDKIARGPTQSPWYLYTQAEIRLQWAITRSRYGDYLTGMSDIKQAYALLEENRRKFPDFAPNKKSLGIMHALIGNVPEEYRWVVRSLGGMDGSMDQGMRELEEALAYAKKNDFIFEDETTVAYALLQLHLNNRGDLAWSTLKNSKLTPKTNPLAAFVMATVAMRTGQNDEAIRLLQEAPAGNQHAPFHQRNYLLGLAKLRRLDGDANKALETFLNNFKGENGIKEAYQKLAWYHLALDNDNGYRTYTGFVKIKGAANTEGDKAALHEASSGEMPDQRLLQARLLFDGGYYQRAFDLLKNNAADYAADRKKNLEYTYRLGRITHKMGKTKDAIRLYTLTVDNGAKDPWYFACNAALQLGLLYEEKKDAANARAAFNRCLGMKPEEYAASLHAQAKAGLGRVK